MHDLVTAYKITHDCTIKKRMASKEYGEGTRANLPNHVAHADKLRQRQESRGTRGRRPYPKCTHVDCKGRAGTDCLCKLSQHLLG